MSRFFSVRGASKSKNCDGGDSCTCGESNDGQDGVESDGGSLESRLEALEDAVSDSDGQPSNGSGGDADGESTPQGGQNGDGTGQTVGGSGAAPRTVFASESSGDAGGSVGTALAGMNSNDPPAQSRDSAQAETAGANRLPRVPEIHANHESGTFDGAVATDAEAQVRGMPSSWQGLMRLKNEQENAESDGSDENPGANRIGMGMPAENSANGGESGEPDVERPVTVFASDTDGESGRRR